MKKKWNPDKRIKICRLTENRKIVYYKNSHIFWDWMQEEKSYEMSVLQQWKYKSDWFGPADDNNSIRRRRLCDDCGKRFTTYEKVETIPLIIIKKDNNREQYNRTKIEKGVLLACHKRPISAEQISKLVDDVEIEILTVRKKRYQVLWSVKFSWIS